MLARIRAARERRRAAVVEAEALVWAFGARGVAMAEAFARDPAVSAARRAHHVRVARLADRRQRFLEGLDLATRYEELERCRGRHGTMAGAAGPTVIGAYRGADGA